MTKEELREHCEKQVKMCEEWAKGNDREPSGKIYEEHKLILELIKASEQQPCNDCVSRKAVDKLCIRYLKTPTDENVRFYEEFCSLPPVIPTHCIAEVKFSKDDLREICNERIEIECTHGTCKDCKHWKDSDGVYRRGIGAESKCPINNSRVYEGTFYCADFDKRGSKNESNN